MFVTRANNVTCCTASLGSIFNMVSSALITSQITMNWIIDLVSSAFARQIPRNWIINLVLSALITSQIPRNWIIKRVVVVVG